MKAYKFINDSGYRFTTVGMIEISDGEPHFNVGESYEVPFPKNLKVFNTVAEIKEGASRIKLTGTHEEIYRIANGDILKDDPKYFKLIENVETVFFFDRPNFTKHIIKEHPAATRYIKKIYLLAKIEKLYKNIDSGYKNVATVAATVDISRTRPHILESILKIRDKLISDDTLTQNSIDALNKYHHMLLRQTPVINVTIKKINL